MGFAKTSEKFNELYQELNAEQKQAVDAIEGPVMVVAGPGTGKTQALTLRIANILKETDAEPEQILALTFTEAAAFEMRKRLVALMGSVAYRVAIFTFHGFCNELILRHAEKFPEIISSSNATQADQIRILQSIVDHNSFEHLKPLGDPYYYVKPALREISSLKREGIGVAEFSKQNELQAIEFVNNEEMFGKAGEIKAKFRTLAAHLGKNKELALMYELYQKQLRELRLYDYDDMILHVVKKLAQDTEFLFDLQERYLYVLADEHQDVNNAQNRVLELLGNYDPNPNIFIVGDEKQAIFRFQGASLENFLYFQRKFPKAKLIRLVKNYRSTQSILDAASHIMKERKSLLISQGKEYGKPLEVLGFSSMEAELFGIASQAEKLIEEGTKPEHIAVLCRDNKDAFPFARMFEKRGLAYALESGQDAFSDEYTREAIILLKAVWHFGEGEYLAPVLHLDFLKIDPLDVYKVISFAANDGISLYEVLKKANARHELDEKSQIQLRDVYEKLARWNRESKNVSAIYVFERILQESGLLAAALAENNYEEIIEKLQRLLEEIRNSRRFFLADFMEYLQVVEDQGLELERKTSPHIRSGVRLMTAHRSKGREFDYVFIVNCADKHWGNRRNAQLFHLPKIAGGMVQHTNEEERKLFYVALTRARKHLFITYAKQGVDGRGQLPSVFVEEIDPALVKEGNAEHLEQELREHPELVFTSKQQVRPKEEEQKFLRELFFDRGLSVTALNNYLECPWKYFYVSLLRIPQAQSAHQLFGIAVHGALEQFFKAYHADEASKEYLLDVFDQRLRKVGLGEREYKEFLKKGAKALAGYYQEYNGKWARNTIGEFAVKDVELEIGEDRKLRLTGKFDKVEFLGEGNEVNVVDYKTGGPKSRADIEGKTKTSRGNYYRQLVFYQLLLNQHKDGMYKMVSGEIDFVEPNPRGKHKKEKFVIAPQETQRLEELIFKTAREISNFEFWNRACDKPDCKWCALRQM